MLTPVELTTALCPVGATYQAFALREESLNKLDHFLVKLRFSFDFRRFRMEVEVKRQGPRDRRAHHRCVTHRVSTRNWARERVEVDKMPNDDLRRALCVELMPPTHPGYFIIIMRLDCLAAFLCIPKDHVAERCTASLWHVLDEQVLTTCQRPRRVVTLFFLFSRCKELEAAISTTTPAMHEIMTSSCCPVSPRSLRSSVGSKGRATVSPSSLMRRRAGNLE